MSGVAVRAGRDLGGVKRINLAHWNDDDSQRSSWLAALRQHLHLKPAELEPLLAISEATMARRVREQVASERLDLLVEVISLAAPRSAPARCVVCCRRSSRGLPVMASAGIKRASVLCGYDVPAEPALIQDLDPKALPDGWNAIPHGQASARWGGNWLRSGRQLGLVLPSVVVHQARNLLLNPFTPRSKTKIDQVTPDFSASGRCRCA